MTRNDANRTGRPSLGRRLAALGERVDTLAARLDKLQPAPGGSEESQAGQQRYFTSLDDFVGLWLLPTFRRPVTALGMATWHWCPRWWAHPEARMVFGTLWDQFEANRTEPLGMVELTRDLLQFLPQVCGAHGPFARCRNNLDQAGHTPRHQQVSTVPTEPAPPGWWDGWWGDEDQTDPNRPQLMFAGVEDFTVGLLLPTFRRDPNAVGMQRWNWCDQWWRHDEVVHHYLNLWYLFEARAPHKRLVEFVREVYFLLPHIHGDAGPMRECTPSGKPGGPRHVDLTIAAVEHRPATNHRGVTATADWLGEHIMTVQPSRQPTGPDTYQVDRHRG